MDITSFIYDNYLYIIGVLFVLLLFICFQQRRKIKAQKNRIKLNENDFKESLETEKSNYFNKIEIIQKECEAKISDINRKMEEAIENEKKISEDKCRQQREYIESDREKIISKDDKEILTDIVMALGGYAKRIERLETSVNSLNLTKQIAEYSADISQKFDELNKLFNEVSSSVNEISSTVDSINDKIDSVDDSTDVIYKELTDEYGYETTKNIVSEIKSSLSSISSDIDDIKETVNSAASNVDY